MSGPITLSYYTSRGTVYYTPTNFSLEKSRPARLPEPPCRPRQRRPHSIHITRLPAGFVPFDLRPPPPPPQPKKASRFRIELRKLASRENAKRVLGSVFSPFTSLPSPASPSAGTSSRSTTPDTSRPLRTSFSTASADPNTIFARRAAAGILLDEPTMSRPPLGESSNGATPRNSISAASLVPSKSTHEAVKPVCSGNGVSCSIILAEPVLYLVGLDHDGTNRDSSSNSAILRGKLQLKITKSAKLKAVTLKFSGKTRTDWPEGMVPRPSQLCSKNLTISQAYLLKKQSCSRRSHFEIRLFRSSMHYTKAQSQVTAHSATMRYETSRHLRRSLACPVLPWIMPLQLQIKVASLCLA
jgi:hypothetical protein